MNDELLVALAAKLGTTTEYLWGVLIKQAPIYGYTYMLGTVLLWVTLAYICNWLLWHSPEDDNYTPKWIAFYISAAIIIVPTIVSVIELNTAIAALFNPEYWALLQVKNLVR